MELVFTLLVVVLLVVLPVAFFLLAIGGLVYAVRRALGREKVPGSSAGTPAPNRRD